MIIYTDGGYNKTGAYGSGLLEIDDGTEYKMLRWKFSYPVHTNNEAEYAALLETLLYTLSIGIRNVIVYSDSLLMVSQVNRKWKINKDRLREFAEKVWELLPDFDTIILRHVPRKIIFGKLGH